MLSLALGAIFSLIDAVMLKSLPVKNPGQPYQISHVGTHGISEGSNYPLFEQFRDRNHVFSEIFAANLNQWKVSVNGETEFLVGQVVTGNYGVNTVLGRPITIEDDRVRKGHPGDTPTRWLNPWQFAENAPIRRRCFVRVPRRYWPGLRRLRVESGLLTHTSPLLGTKHLLYRPGGLTGVHFPIP